MKKKTINPLKLQKFTIANLQSLTGGGLTDRNLVIGKLTDGCPPITEGCNDTQHGGTCQRTIA